MKKRLRKKLHKGEFRELGFSFDAKFKADTEMSVVAGVGRFVERSFFGDGGRLEFPCLRRIYYA